MKIVTINIPDQYLDCIETMVNMGFYPSRSEAVRAAIKLFLQKEVNLNAGMQADAFYEMKREQQCALLR